MKTKDLIDSINNESGYIAVSGVVSGFISIYHKHTSDNLFTKAGEVSRVTENVLDLDSFPGELTDEIKSLVVQYANTPLSDRKSSDKYMVKLQNVNHWREPLYLDEQALGFGLSTMPVKEEDCKSMEFTMDEIVAAKNPIRCIMGEKAIIKEATTEREWFKDNYWYNYKA